MQLDRFAPHEVSGIAGYPAPVERSRFGDAR